MAKKPEKDEKRLRGEVDGELGLHIVELPFSKIDREAHHISLLEEGAQEAARFPELLSEILQLFRSVYPPHILAAIAYYATCRRIGPEGVSAKSLLPEVEQHHLELLQALLCTLPRSEWGMEPAGPTEIQAAIDAVRALAKAFHRRRLLELREVQNEEQGFAVGLQEQIRDYTQMVRNWGYYSDMLRIAAAAHASLDSPFEAFHGFSASEFLTVVNEVVEVYGERLNRRTALLHEIFRHRTRKALVHDFFARYEGVAGDPDEFLAGLPKRMTLRELRLWLRAHADRWLIMEMLIQPDIVAGRLGMPERRVRRIFEAVAMYPGSLVGSDPERLFLANPAWQKPCLRTGDEFIFFAPQSIVSFIWPIFRRLCEAAGLKKALERRRAKFLEESVANAIAVALPDAVLQPNVKWTWQGRGYETDLIVVVDRVVLIVEAKSGVISDVALRGGSKAMRTHIKDLLIEPAEQSARLRDILVLAGQGDPAASGIARQLGVDATKVERIIRLSVTLDDFSSLASAEAELKRAGWLPGDLALPPTMNLAELGTCVDILDGPLFFLHYLTARERIQGATPIFGYEHDYLGLYLESGLDLPELHNGTHKGMIAGMAAALDRYYLSRDQGVTIAKPQPRIGPYLRSVLRSFQTRRAPTWAIMGLTMLDAIPPGSDAELESEIEALAQSVFENWRDPSHQSVMVGTGPCRRALAIFHVFPETLREGLLERLNVIAENVMEDQTQQGGVVIARMLEQWQRPYEIAARLKPVVMA